VAGPLGAIEAAPEGGSEAEPGVSPGSGSGGCPGGLSAEGLSHWIGLQRDQISQFKI